MKANDKGTPQGGIISPLLANLYMHWFDKVFYGPNGPASFAKATLVRYADDFVVMAKYMTTKVRSWIENLLEQRFDLTINREKTKIVDLAKPQNGINFLGFNLKQVTLQGKKNVKLFYLGAYFYYGRVGSPSYEKAFKYYKLAADQGFVHAQYEVTKAYHHGLGTDKNPQFAFQYCKMATDQGLPEAQNTLGTYFDHGMGVEKSPQEAFKYFQLAADQGYAIAQSNLGLCFKQGKGSFQSDEKACEYFKLAADQGLALGQYYLGLCFKMGVGIEQSDEEAFKYFHLSAEQNFVKGQYQLALCFFEGKGTKQSFEQSLEYFKLADNQGIIEAKSKIEECEKILDQQENDAFIIDPLAEKLNVDNYLEKHDLKMLRTIFEKMKNTPVYLEAANLSEEELKVICNALITNHRFAFIGSQQDMEVILKIFQEAGHHLNSLWREKLKKQDTQEIVYGLRFREQIAA